MMIPTDAVMVQEGWNHQPELFILWWTYKKLWKMAIEIVDFPIKNGDFPLLC